MSMQTLYFKNRYNKKILILTCSLFSYVVYFILLVRIFNDFMCKQLNLIDIFKLYLVDTLKFHCSVYIEIIHTSCLLLWFYYFSVSFLAE